MGEVKRTLHFTSVSSSEEVIHTALQLYFTKKLDPAVILGQVGSPGEPGRCPGARLVMGEVPPGGTCGPRSGCGGPETVGPSLGAPGDRGSCLPSQPRNRPLPGRVEEGAAGQSPQGEPHGEGPHQDVSRELRGSVLGLPSASVGRAPERVQLLRAGPGAPGGGRQAPPRRAGDLGHRGWARPLPRPVTLKPPGRLRLGWGWGRRWRVRVLEVWNNDGGSPRLRLCLPSHRGL